VQQQERQLIGGGETSESRSRINNINNQDWRTHCNREGTGWRMQDRGRSKNYGKQCSYCHKMNHSANECY